MELHHAWNCRRTQRCAVLHACMHPKSRDLQDGEPVVAAAWIYLASCHAPGSSVSSAGEPMVTCLRPLLTKSFWNDMISGHSMFSCHGRPAVGTARSAFGSLLQHHSMLSEVFCIRYTKADKWRSLLVVSVTRVTCT